MTSTYIKLQGRLETQQNTWLVTGAAGFIGSHLVEKLLKLNQKVVGLDNFSTGYKKNINEVLELVSHQQKNKFLFLEGDIRNPADCNKACEGADYILHQAALGSVPRSIADPKTTHDVNVTGFLNMLQAAKETKVKKIIYASSSAIYGDSETLPKVESQIGNLLSPYAATKYFNELYSTVFAKNYNIAAIGLRYFNVFGARQDPEGAYAAVIPKWIKAMLNDEEVIIYGDGETSRDFCYVDNVVQANLLAAIAGSGANNKVYNVAAGERTTLNQLFNLLQASISVNGKTHFTAPIYKDFRSGDIKHSLADISSSGQDLEYSNPISLKEGIENSKKWYFENC